MILTPNIHVAHVWLMEAGCGNVLAALVHEPGGPWLLQITSRIFVDDKAVEDSKDVRAVNTAQLPVTTLEAAFKMCEDKLPRLARFVLGTADFKRCRIDVHGDRDKALEMFRAHPSLHALMPKGAVQA